MQCKICHNPTQIAFETTILGHYKEIFYKCQYCGFLAPHNIHWLQESYTNAINASDTGIVARNLSLYKIVSVVAYMLFGFRSKHLGGGQYIASESPIIVDIGGGTGLLVRLLRDVGLEAFWQDEYCENIFARGFEWNQTIKPTLLTSFEVFEHLPNPQKQISAMLNICPNILFSTELLPESIPPHQGDNTWWYYGFHHGQHISFYAKQTLEYIAKQHNLHLCSYGSIHLLSQKALNQKIFAALIKLSNKALFPIIRRLYTSKTLSDHHKLLSSLM